MSLRQAIQKQNWLIISSFAFLFSVKVYLVSFMQSPWVVDGFVYAQAARAIIDQFSLVPLNLSPSDYQFYPPGYSMVIAIPFLLNDPELAYRATLILNSFLTTLVIPLSYFLARPFLGPKHSLMTALAVGFSPTVVPYIFVIMSENLFIPVFMLTLLALYYATSRMDTKLWFLVGFLIAFLVLIRIQGIAMVAGLGAVLLLGATKSKIDLRNCLAAVLGLATALLPYLFYRASLAVTITGYEEGRYISNLYSAFTTSTGLSTFFRLTLNELGYLFVCGLGILTLFGCLFVWKGFKAKDLPSKYMALYFGVSGIITVFITVIHMHGACLNPSGRNPQVWYEVFGRYLDPIMTPLIAFGLIYYFSHTYFSWRIKAGLVAMAIFFVSFFPLGTYHPGATWAIIYLQYFKGSVSHQLILFSVIGLTTLVLLRSYHEWFKTFYIIMIFSLINIPAAHFQINNGQTETVGLWIKRQSSLAEQVYVDESTVYSERMWRSVTFWNPSLKIDYLNLKTDYLVLENYINEKTLLITDKSLMNLKAFEDEFWGHKIYEIGFSDYE